ncbi:MAG: hypothetical protein IT426_04120 [Pirellulales bacterium]|nr:hypothetical protein [Pirellulales bacterium]
MFEKISFGWELVGQSFRVLREDKRLLVFPLLSGIACSIVLASFVVPLWGSPQAEAIMHDKHIPNDPLSYVLLFLFYFANYFAIVFFNSALVACAIGRFRGNEPTIGDGLRVAAARIPQIVAWALVSATIGLILKAIESNSEKAGQFVAGLLGAAWSVLTYLVVPVLVMEKANPVEAFKRSTALVKKTWGEALTAHLSTGLVFTVVFLVALIPLLVFGALAVYAFANGIIALGALAVAVIVIVVMLISLVSSALSAILLASLYLYAAEGTVPQSFDRQLLEGAFKAK